MLRQEAARSAWLRMMFTCIAQRALARPWFASPSATSSTPSSLDGLAATLADFKACGRRWMVRREGLSAEEEALVSHLGIPERARPSRYLPPNAIAVIFDETPDDSAPLGTRIAITVVRGVQP